MGEPTLRVAEFGMYVAPPRVVAAQEQWLEATLAQLRTSGIDTNIERDPIAKALSLQEIWRAPHLLLAQTCGYPLKTQLTGQVTVVGRPDFDLPHALSDGRHCSVIVVRAGDSRGIESLTNYRGARGLVNSEDSNSGMNLFRHTLASFHTGGAFFESVTLTGGHRASLRALKAGAGDLAAIDSITWDYLARDESDEVAGLTVVTTTAPCPCLPYITCLGGDASTIREAMNTALAADPALQATLAIKQVLPASESDYEVVLEYEREAAAQGFPTIFASCA